MPTETTPTPTEQTSTTTTTTTGADGTPTTSSARPRVEFPSDLATHGHFVVFTAYKYTRKSRGTPNAQRGQSAGDIALPMPSSLTTGYAAQYNNQDLGIFGTETAQGMIGEVLKGITKNASSLSDVHKNTKVILESMGSKGINNLPGAAAYILLDTFEDTGLGGAVQANAGLARNPHMAMLFRGVNFRSHTFSYTLVPKNEDETRAIYNIIKFFKTWMLPSYFQGYNNNLFEYPYEFGITFQHPDFLFNIADSVLETFNVNYHAAGSARYLNMADGKKAPLAVQIDMTFRETTICTRETVTNQDANQLPAGITSYIGVVGR